MHRIIYILSIFFGYFGLSPVNSQYSITRLEESEILLYWENNPQSIETIAVDNGTVSSFTKNDSLFIHMAGLQPASFVNLSVVSRNGSAVEIQKTPFITKSESSGQIRVYFNTDVNTAFQKQDFTPAGTSYNDVQVALKKIIRDARLSIDLAAYNTNEIFLVNELIDAWNRGVRIRVVTDDETTNSGWSGGVPFPIVDGNLGSGLMHNKFIIVDAASSDSSYVIMGSMNFTSNQMRRDPNHLIFIQDQSLAKTYQMEFEEMWGSGGAIPNIQAGRFGAQKIKNTPKDFVIGDVPAELYFSPTDGTTEAISREIMKSKKELLFGLMIFTNWELRDEVGAKTSSGIETRWIVDDEINSSGVINVLKQAGAEIYIHSHPDIFHHKYAIIDENDMNPTVITGSHNWTFSAETINDENTIIFHDTRLSNIFRQEFEARWSDLSSITEENPDFEDQVVYPNPNHGFLYVKDTYSQPLIYTMYGVPVPIDIISPGCYQWNGIAGIYIVQIGTNVYKLIRI